MSTNVGRTPVLQLMFGAVVVAWFLGSGLFYLQPSHRAALVRTDIDHVFEPPRIALLAQLLDRRPVAVRSAHEVAGSEEGEIPLGEHLPEARAAAKGNASFAPFGTDATGRSVALLVASAPAFYLLPMGLYVTVALVVMVAVGCASALLRHNIAGRIAQYTVEVNHSLPQLVVVLAALALSGFSIVAFALTLGVVSGLARSLLVSNKVEAVLSTGFRDAIHELGISPFGVLWTHLLRGHLRALLLVQIPFLVAELVLFEACLGYLHHPVGTGLSYGSMLAGAIRNLNLGTDWLFAFPAAAIVVSIWGFTALGSGLSRLFRVRNPHSI